ncbi:hypothetical protein JAAARDRAFT_196130 [Jaapia argillacea MUCL 33604]|uniref:No apical meristem-associated C-terminal domain-containing protein n=1 Tax=Jaapia argillacea MUCL 33604 TaxID=933084 RepID=A0A067PY79_9AGAM|nr:hypothetical protein JAAARDRAFT_196130 [Jaapia argillacea MUCL 33604]
MSNTPTPNVSGSERAAPSNKDGGEDRKQEDKATKRTREDRSIKSDVQLAELEAKMKQYEDGLTSHGRKLILEVSQQMTYTQIKIKVEETRMKMYDDVDEYIEFMLEVIEGVSERSEESRDAEMRD